MDNINNVEKEKISLPLAVIICGLLIALAIIYTDRNDFYTNKNDILIDSKNEDTDSLDKIRPVSQRDHIRGKIGADITIVEYSDTECPFCKQFHNTMKKIFNEYGGSVTWVYRHFPLDKLHSKARNEAVALECAGEIGGNEKFWSYTDRLYETTPSNDGLLPQELLKIANYISLDQEVFKNCLSSDRYDKYIEDDLNNATLTGGRGTPWSILIDKDGNKHSISGAWSYDSLKKFIDDILADKN